MQKNLAPVGFQTFFVSREMSNCPLIAEITSFAKKLDKLDLGEDVDGSMSMGYGRRILINGRDSNLLAIQQEEMVELVDYDPVKNIIVAMGKTEPCCDAPVHWLVQKARHDVNAVLLVTGNKIVEHLLKTLPVTEHEAPLGTVALAKEVLKTLRRGKQIGIKSSGALFVGLNLTEVEDAFLKLWRGRSR